MAVEAVVIPKAGVLARAFMNVYGCTLVCQAHFVPGKVFKMRLQEFLCEKVCSHVLRKFNSTVLAKVKHRSRAWG